ncbi:MAG: histidine ammonia-lyase [Gammaproteobacteria bacterium]|nr:histidine ammonia-lyase [Gammaproteobacteria bacterium]
MEYELQPGQLSYKDLIFLQQHHCSLRLNANHLNQIAQSQKVVEAVIAENQVVYGINTGFGALAAKRVPPEDLQKLQESLILSHAAGTGNLLDDTIVKLILLLKINSLARGFSGVRIEVIQALCKIYNAQIYPCIPRQGSVGASGDLAPLAHLSTVLLGVGTAHHENQTILATEALAKINLVPLQLAPKEGLALLNGTQVSTALALNALLQFEKIFIAALVTGALTVDAVKASEVPFDALIQEVRGHAAQIKVAELLRELLKGSSIIASHVGCDKVQDPYSLRCQPQVMGACLESLLHVSRVLMVEANAVSDNPLVFSAENKILSGGNFHAEPVAMAADYLALAIAEVGALAERRIALLMDPHFSQLPPFLVENSGVNSGFMMAQVTAAALASENKALAVPSSIDSLPTSANQEDHVSMATYAAFRLQQMVENTAAIIAIELLAACQGIDFRRPLTTSPRLEKVHHYLRSEVPFYAQDRFFAPDIAKAKQLVLDGILSKLTEVESILLSTSFSQNESR